MPNRLENTQCEADPQPFSETGISPSALARLESMFPGEFGKPLVLGVTWQSVTDAIKKAGFAEEEKEFFRRHYRSREAYDMPGLTDKSRFATDRVTDLSALLTTDDRHAANLLLYMGPRLIHETYGEGVLFWVWHMVTTGVVADHAKKAFEDYLKRRTEAIGSEDRFELVMKARNTLWRTHRKSEIVEVLALYDLFLRLGDFVRKTNREGLPGKFAGLSLERIETIRDFEKSRVRRWEWKDVSEDGTDLSDRVAIVDENYFTLEEFQRSFWKCKDWSGRGYRLYLDSPVGIALMKDGFPIAVTGFSLRDADTLFVNQFQQVAYDAYDRHGRMIGSRVDEAAKRLDWQEFFYGLLTDFARESRYSKIVLQSWDNNFWTETPREIYDAENGRTVPVPIDVPHLSREIAHKIYDAFAVSHGFTREDDEGDWVKALK